MENIVFDGCLEVRRSGGSQFLSGSFPLGRQATMRSSGRVRKERFKRGNGGSSMSWQFREFQKVQAKLADDLGAIADDVIAELEDELLKRNTHLLVGHSYDRAVADTLTGNLALTYTDDAVRFSATLPDEDDMPSWIRDAVLGVRGGQIRGVSPGFQVTSKGKETLIPEPGNPGVFIREIQDAVVYEFSLVSRPAYSGTELSARHAAVTCTESHHSRGAFLWL